MISIKDVLERTENDLSNINYYERYIVLGSTEKIIEQSRQDTLMALFFKPEIVEEIINALIRAIADSADVRENIHGEWKLERTRFGYYCNKCKMYSYWSTNFCPNCGADMRGKTE